MPAIERHNEEVHLNLVAARRKPLLRRIYRIFHQQIAARLTDARNLATVELGSGIGDITEVIPGCVRTDLFPNPWIDRTENAYALSFADAAVSNLILFDVVHHLRHPGTALDEFHRVLRPGGRLVLFEPCLSVLGWLVYGAFHPEPLARFTPIQWRAPPGWTPGSDNYYAAQANATRIFLKGEFRRDLAAWKVIERRRWSAISYVASGGYSGPQLYPCAAFALMRALDAACDRAPWIFATRLLVVLEK